MDFSWNSEYEKLASKFLSQHFGDARGVTNFFPCMRDDYPWGDHRPDVIDSRVPAKNNTEYHGLERLAAQYYATAQYDYAYHHWLIAALWRHEDMRANEFNDHSHEKAIEYCVKQAMYCKALREWQQNAFTQVAPEPENYGLTSRDLQSKEDKALSEIEAARDKHQEKRP